MSRELLDQLFVPTPPYSPRPLMATLAMAEEEKPVVPPEVVDEQAEDEREAAEHARALQEARDREYEKFVTESERQPVEPAQEKPSGSVVESPEGRLINERIAELNRKAEEEKGKVTAQPVADVPAQERAAEEADRQETVQKIDQAKEKGVKTLLTTLTEELESVERAKKAALERKDTQAVKRLEGQEQEYNKAILNEERVKAGSKVDDVITEGKTKAKVLEVNAEGRPTRLETIEPTAPAAAEKPIEKSNQEEVQINPDTTIFAKAQQEAFKGSQKPAVEAADELAAEQERKRKEGIEKKKAMTRLHSEALKEDAVREQVKAEQAKKKKEEPDFDIEFPQPEQKEPPKLDNLAAVQSFIEFSRRTGRSPEFIRGLEELRKEYAAKAEQPSPRPEPAPAPAEKEVASEEVKMSKEEFERRLAQARQEGGAKAHQRKEAPSLAVEQPSGGGEKPPSESLEAPAVHEEESEPAGQAQEAVARDIHEIEQMGDTRKISFWTRIGAFREQKMHDTAVWWNSIGARIAKEKLVKQEERVRKLETAAKEYAEGSVTGQILSPLRYRLRILLARRRRDELEARQNYFTDQRVRHENARNEILNGVAHQLELKHRTHEQRARRYEEAATELDHTLEELNGVILEQIQLASEETDFEKKHQILEQKAWLERQYQKKAEEMTTVMEALATENQESLQAQYLKDRYLRRSKLPDQTAAEQAPRAVGLKTRQRASKVFTKRAA